MWQEVRALLMDPHRLTREYELEKGEFESRITRLRERQHTLERQIEQLQEDALSRNELQLIVGRLEDFAVKVTGSIDNMGFTAQRDLIRTLVKRIEIDRENTSLQLAFLAMLLRRA